MPTATSTIEAYDDYAEKWTDRARRRESTARTYCEQPAMRAQLPDLTGQDVLCIGCGSGEECQYLLSLGAKSVVGIDISDGQIQCARKLYPDMTFKTMDMEYLDFVDKSFDFVYSSLVMHYTDSWQQTLREVYRVLKNGGRMLLSTHHPTIWGGHRVRDDSTHSVILGYRKDLIARTCEIYGDYFDPRIIHDTWFGDFQISFFHRPLADLMRDILESRFLLSHFSEPRVIDEARNHDPIFWEIHRHIPLFLILELEKQSDE